MTKTVENKPIAALIEAAEKSLGEAHVGSLVWFYLAMAAIYILGQIADNIARRP